MMKTIINKFLTIAGLLISIAGVQTALAQGGENDGGTVTTVLKPHSSDGIFSSTASYTFQVTNNYKNAESGKISYVVTTETGKKVKADSIHIKIGGKVLSNYDFEIPGLKAGFYKINFMIN